MFDLLFIIFGSANLSLAFDTLFGNRWGCNLQDFGSLPEDVFGTPPYTCIVYANLHLHKEVEGGAAYLRSSTGFSCILISGLVWVGAYLHDQCFQVRQYFSIC